MFEPVRGGTRGGQAEFKWSDVSADKDRENYLGHSVNAPTGRWQKNKDVHWYNRDIAQGAAERAEEIRKVKEAEADALAVALGFAPAPKTAIQPETSPSGSTTNPAKAVRDESADAERTLQKDEKRRRKAERKEEKRARKEKRRGERAGQAASEDGDRRRNRSRSRSPLRRQSRERDDLRARHPRRTRSLSRTPPREQRPRMADYDVTDREWERERDRRRWDLNARREAPGAQWGRR